MKARISNGLCEQASTVFFLASTSSHQISLASSKHFCKSTVYLMAFDNTLHNI